MLPLIKQLNKFIYYFCRVTQTAKQTYLRVPIRMDIPAQFFTPDMLCRTKGNLTLAVPLGPAWTEKQPRLFFWMPHSHFLDQWVPDPYFRLTENRQGDWREVEYGFVNNHRLRDSSWFDPEHARPAAHPEATPERP